MKKSLVIAGLTLATVGAIGSSSLAFASDTFEPMGFTTSLAKKISQTFGIDQNEVQKVLDSYRNDHHSDHMRQLADDGTLTAEQKTLLENKRAELQPRMDEIRAMTNAADRRTAMKKIRDEMDQWRQENGIELPTPNMKDSGMGMGMGMMDRN